MPLEHFFEPKYSLTKALGVKRQNIHSYILTEICLTFHEVNYWNLSFAGMSDYPSVTIQQKQVTSMYPIHHSVLQYSSMETTISKQHSEVNFHLKSKFGVGSVLKINLYQKSEWGKVSLTLYNMTHKKDSFFDWI